ncbi:caspase-1 isoform X1 [Choloepus didactylus]|uniref:caspase-1 isoform X1 n=1 Tax=Choloepus didactylus TaxID=27675 RepID=UPI00189FA2BA|nr:caspase-1 isoform X1 [Choloepus didactylus]
MADIVLKEKRKLFIQSVDKGIMSIFLDDLLEDRVLSQEEMERIRDENPAVTDKARALIDSVIKKGSQASQIFINRICEEDPLLAKKLGISAAFQAVQVMPAALTSLGPDGRLKLCPQEVAQRIWREKSAEIYPIMERSNRTRLALIICNTEFESLPRRAGADADIRGMKALLEGLGYTVDVKENLTASDMATELKAFAARPEHRNSDSTFLVFMSHGIRDGICGKKYSEKVPDVLDVNTIFQMMNNRNCPVLKDKPKVIIIQACRGENQGIVWLKDSVKDCVDSPSLPPEDFEDDAIKKAHVEKDFIAFCSSTPDNVSWRHPIQGSLFIMELVKTFQEHAWSCDLEEIFRKVRFSFEMPDNRAQMPTAERVTLTRSFYLFPGY